MIPVSPETGRPMGPARKPTDGGYWHQRFCWSPDSERIAVERRNEEAPGDIYALSVEDGTLTQITNEPVREYYASWSSDSRSMIALAEDGDGKGFWIMPLTGNSPFMLELDVSVAGKPLPLYSSPDRSELAFVVPRGDETEDLYVVPVSLQDGRTTGPAVMVFSGWDRKHYHHRALESSYLS